ncbi:mucin-19-like isoform X1 [Carassius auratus]|uniref:Mucin-19-like isoform X1 n=1 Tax=Carassius auratus TaxID=7957 RepID=A0A6P6KT25_CARAU|nr:mucin-19-like isoform X1 [Carassius auratus]
MDQRWTGLLLPVIFFLFWRIADGFKYSYPPPPSPSNFKECAFSGTCGTHSNHGWGQPSDAFSPPAVQSSMSEVYVTKNLPIEEVGSSLFPKKTLKIKSKLNPLQFVKGGSSIYRSTSHAQTASSSSVSTTLPLSLNQQTSSSSASSGSTIPGVSGGLSLERYPEMSSQFQPLVVSSQSTNSQSSPSLHMVRPQSSSKSTDDATPLYTRGSVSYRSFSSQSHGSANSQGNSGAKLSANSIPKRVGSGYYSGMLQSLSTSSPYTPGSLMAKKPDSLPLGVSSQSTNVQSSPSLSTSSTQSRSGTRSATSRYFIPVQEDHRSVSLSHKSTGTLGQYAPMSPTKYASAPMSAPQATRNSRSSYRAVSQAGSLSQMGASGPLTSLGGKYYRGLLPQSQATSSQYALGYSKPFSSPHSTGGLAGSVLSSRKQYNSGAPFGASTGLASQGMSSSNTGSVPSQGTTSQFAPGASPYASVSHSLPKTGPSSTGQASGKQLTSTHTGSSSTQAGSSTQFILHRSTAYGASHQPQNIASQSAFKSPSSYTSGSLSSSQADPSSTVPGSQKQHASTYMGSSGNQAGSSSFTLQGSTASGGLAQPQGPASLFSLGSPTSYPGSSLSSTQTGSSTVPDSLKQLTFSFMGSPDTQMGSSTSFILQGSTDSGGQPHQPADAASPSAPGSPSYASLSVSSSQAGPSTTLGSPKQFTSAYQGSSGAQFGASTDVSSQDMSSGYSGSVQSKGKNKFAPVTSLYANVSLSSPEAGPSTVPGSLRQLTFTFMGSPDTQTGSSTPILQGKAAYGGSHQPQAAASQSASGSPSYASLSLSLPQAGLSTTMGSQKPFTSAYQGGSGAQIGASADFASQEMTSSYSGSLQSPGTTNQFAPGSPSSYRDLSFSPQAGPVTFPGFLKQHASSYMGSSGTEAGPSSFTLQGSTASGGLPQPQDIASQFSPGYPSSYPGLSLSLPQAGLSTILGSLKQFAFTFMGSPSTQAGFSSPFSLQGSITYDGSPEPPGTSSQFSPVPHSCPCALSPSQGVASQSTIQGSQKKLASNFAGSSGTQAGSSTPHALQGGTAYGGSSQTQDTSQSGQGPHSSYASVLLSSPKDGPSTNVQGSLKRLASSFVGSSGTHARSSTAILRRSTASGGSSQP